MADKFQQLFKNKNGTPAERGCGGKSAGLLNLHRSKKTVANLLAVLAVGLAILTFSSSIFGEAADSTLPDISVTEYTAPAMAMNLIQNQTADNWSNHEVNLERRLEEILSLVEGAGEVRVMITVRQERELVLASDTIHNTFITRESDSDGGIREISDIKIEERNILIQDNSSSASGSGSRPLILTENAPRIEGIIIIAQGGDNIIVRDALTRASQAVLGIEINRIQVLRMK